MKKLMCSPKTRTVPLVLAAVLLLTSASSVWEGSALTSTGGELPDTGYYVATNSFPRNTVVDVTNLENNRTIRVIVASGLDTPGLIAMLSRDAAAAIGMEVHAIGRVRINQPADPLRLTDGSSTSSDPDRSPSALLNYGGANTDLFLEPEEAVEEAEPEPVVPITTSTTWEDTPPPVETVATLPTSSAPGSAATTATPPAATTPTATTPPVTTTPAVTPPAAATTPPVSAAAETAAPATEAPATAATATPPDSSTAGTLRPLPSPEPLPLSSYPGFGGEESETSTALAAEEEAEEPDDAVSLTDAPGMPPVSVPGDAAAPDLNKALATVPVSQTAAAAAAAPPPASQVTTPVTTPSASPEDYTYSLESTADRIPTPVQQLPAFTVPTIENLEKGKYYIQLVAFTKAESVEPELAKLGGEWPLAIQTAAIGGKTFYRVLVGPVNLGESNALLQRFRGTYKDAFVRLGS